MLIHLLIKLKCCWRLPVIPMEVCTIAMFEHLFEHFFNNYDQGWHGIDTIGCSMKLIFHHLKLTNMKHLLLILAIATVMVSCKSKAKEDTQVLSATQLADYSQFLKWKETQSSNSSALLVNRKAPARVVYNTPKTYATPAAVQTTRKRGWSKAAKGAAIGAGSGAILGAVINKRNRAAGAVIGGILGGGVGYGIGRSKDKKDGR